MPTVVIRTYVCVCVCGHIRVSRMNSIGFCRKFPPSFNIIVVLPTITERRPLIRFPIAAHKRDHEHRQRQRRQAERARRAARDVARLHHRLLARAAQRHRRLRHRVLRQTEEVQVVGVLYETAERRRLQRRRRCVRHRLVN